MDEVLRREQTIFARNKPALPGIDLRSEEQAKLLDSFEAFNSDLPFERTRNPKSRYVHPNGSFPWQDAFILSAMIRHFRPKRFIEVGSGASSCATLDTCEVLGLDTALTFIEPYPEYLLKATPPADRSRFELKQAFIQDVHPSLFAGLQAGDFLFIDTSHASKVGSDVNHIFFEILPLLKPGVFIHFHDIWYPFEYPKEWFFKGMFWNEAYLLRAFLISNPEFEIVMFNSYVNSLMHDRVKAAFPLFLMEPGASLWLRRVNARGTVPDRP
jgi:hypothetical protein